MRFFLFLILYFSCHVLSAQCNLEAHNTSINSGWISCTTSQSPNSTRGIGHWVMYDFSFEYMLERVHIWNYNHPNFLNQGAQSLIIDVSDDGINWTQVATFNVSMASGDRHYIGEDGPMLNVRARYMLVTVASNHGGSCYAIGEVRVGVADEINCQDNYTLNGNLANQKYYAHQTINTTGQVNENAIVHFQAGNQVLLNQGFQTNQSAELEIEMGPCDH